MTLGELSHEIVTRLSAVPGWTPSKAAAVRNIILEDFLDLGRVAVLISSDRVLLDDTVKYISHIVDEISGGMPVQYALGQAEFMGMKLKVTPAVLIPRQETAGLVDLMTDAFGDRTDLRVEDICTGSGCIAIALQRALRFAQVIGTDISDDALAVARENAATLHSPVKFIKADALRMPVPQPDSLDIVVSNPPYIAVSEKAEVAPDVLAYEPHAALFVPDSDPTEFYRSISRYAFGALSPGGGLFFEINPHFADQTRQDILNAGFDSADILHDYTGAKRYARAFKQ